MERKLSQLKLTLLTLLMLLGTALTASAYDFSYNNVYYTITSTSSKTCEVTSGPSAYSGDVTIAANPIASGVTYTCTAIGEGAFKNSTGLTSVFIPNSVTKIGQEAFNGCTSLTSITIPNTVTSMGTMAFSNCSKLSSVTWSTGLKSIPNYTFNRCSKLVNFAIPHWVTSIGDDAFYESGLKQAVLPYGVKTVGVCAFTRAPITMAVVPSSVTSLNGQAFYNCTSLTELHCNMATPPVMDFTGVPSSCKLRVPVGKVVQYKSTGGWSGRSSYVSAGAYDFAALPVDGDPFLHFTVTSSSPVTVDGVTYAGTVKYVYHPNVKEPGLQSYTNGGTDIVDYTSSSGKRYIITEVGDSAFAGMSSSMTSMDFSDHGRLTRIGHDAFYDSYLTKLILPNGVTNIGSQAFAKCNKLTSFVIPNTVTSMGTWAFSYCEKLSSLTWSKGLTFIPSSTFYGCTALANFKIPYWITSVGQYAFYDSGLKQAVLPYGLTNVSTAAFKKSAVTTALVPSSVTSLSSDAFASCSSLTELYCNMATPPSMDFTSVPTSCKMYVPIGKVDNYKAASGWSTRTSYVQAGAYDFNYGMGYDANSDFHWTITSSTPVTVNGITCDGTAMYVYHPNVKNWQISGLTAGLIYADNMCGADKKYVITELGDSCFCDLSSTTTVMDLSGCTKLTKIGKYAFANSKLTKVNLPSSLTFINSYAFFKATALTNITLPNTVNYLGYGVFRGCASLSEVSWSTGLLSIPSYTFYGCTKLADFKFPHWITTIGNDAFYQSGLTKAILPYGLRSISGRAFAATPITTLLIPSSVTSMDVGLNDCTKLTTVYCNMATPPVMTFDNVPTTCMIYVPVDKKDAYKTTSGWKARSTYIQAGAYDYNFGAGGYSSTSQYHMTVTSATPITYNGTTYAGTAKYVYHPIIQTTAGPAFSPSLSETDNMCGSGKRYLITEVGDSCFFKMSSSITSVDLARCEKLTRLGNYAFYDSKVTGVTLPASLKTIGNNAFSSCTMLGSIDIPDAVTSMEGSVFRGCTNLSAVSWSKGLLSIPSYTFYGCTKLADFTIPHWITMIGGSAFSQSGLKQAILPYGLTQIQSSAFSSTPITTLLIPSSVTSMDGGIFKNCSSLTTLYCNRKPSSTMSDNDFTGVPTTCKIYVPVGQLKQYKARWAARENKIEAGAYDFNYGQDGYNATSLYHMTVISATPVTVDGVTYAGKAKYVFHPNIQGTTKGFTPSLKEADYMCGSGKQYLITEIGDSCFYDSFASATTLDFSRCTSLTKLGHDALWASKADVVILPASVRTYGECALYYMPNLTELYVKNPTPVTVPSYCFYSTDQARTTLHVPTQAAVTAYKAADVWRNFYKIVSDGGSGLRGDVNNDGEVNIGDVNAIIDLILRDGFDPAADVNGDGELNIGDVNAVIDIILSK